MDVETELELVNLQTTKEDDRLTWMRQGWGWHIVSPLERAATFCGESLSSGVVRSMQQELADGRYGVRVDLCTECLHGWLRDHVVTTASIEFR